jgi:hypothetical protein
MNHSVFIGVEFGRGKGHSTPFGRAGIPPGGEGGIARA